MTAADEPFSGSRALRSRRASLRRPPMSPRSPHLRVVPAEEDAPAAPDADARSSGPGPAPDPLDREAVYRRYAPYVAQVGLRLLGRRGEVEDLVQDVFLAAQRGLDRLENPEAVKGWLATVAVRKAQRRLRRRALRRTLGLDEGEDYGDVADPKANAATRAQLAEVYRALDRVPAQERIAWSLRHVEGEKLGRVAELCGCSLATTKRRIAAAHARLLVELGEGSEGKGSEGERAGDEGAGGDHG